MALTRALVPVSLSTINVVEAEETDVFWFRDGMLARLQAFPTKAEALRAAEHPAERETT